jgi:hypothetical protein
MIVYYTEYITYQIYSNRGLMSCLLIHVPSHRSKERKKIVSDIVVQSKHAGLASVAAAAAAWESIHVTTPPLPMVIVCGHANAMGA